MVYPQIARLTWIRKYYITHNVSLQKVNIEKTFEGNATFIQEYKFKKNSVAN
jgi:hypothetical protein